MKTSLFPSTRQLQRDRFRDDAEPSDVPLHDHVLPPLVAVRGGVVDVVPHPLRGHPGEDGAAGHAIPGPGELFFTVSRCRYFLQCQDVGV